MKNAENLVLKNFIVLEGLDGAGTTTQLNRLKENCLQRNIPAFCTWEPSAGPVGLLIRRVLAKEIAVHPGTLARLYAADRYDHLYTENEGILARLKRGEFVFCDRYLFSSLAYQSLECRFEDVLAMNRYPLPEYLFFLDVSQEECRRRLRTRNKEELFDAEAIQQAIRENYQKAFDYFADTGMIFHRIDGSLDPDSIFEKIWSLIPPLPIMER